MDIEKDKEQPKRFYKSIMVIYVYGTWCVIAYFIWKPLVIPFLVLLSGYGSTYLRKKLVYGLGYLRPIVSGLAWGIILAFALYYLNGLTNAPLPWKLANYFFGFLAAGYIGYKDSIVSEISEAYYITAQLTAITSYILSLLLLHFVF